MVRSLSVGGAERQVALLARAMADRGVGVSVVCFYGGGAFEEELAEAGVPVVVAGKRGRWDVFGGLSRVVSALRAARADVIYSFLPGPNLVALLARPFCRGVSVIWGVRSTTVDPAHEDRVARAVNRVEALCARWVPMIIVNSEAGARDAVARGMPSAAIRIVPNGVDTDRFQPMPQRRAEARRRWGVPTDALVVGALGRLHPMKDHVNFLRAASLVRVQRDDTWFAVVGDDERGIRDDLLDTASELGIGDRFVTHPAESDAAAVYPALDVLVSSSRYGEGFPNVVGEAMACEVPCVVTDVGDSARVVGPAGIVVSPAAPKDLAAAVLRAVKDPSMGPAGRARIMGSFSVDSLVDATMALVGELIAARTGERR